MLAQSILAAVECTLNTVPALLPCLRLTHTAAEKLASYYCFTSDSCPTLNGTDPIYNFMYETNAFMGWKECVGVRECEAKKPPRHCLGSGLPAWQDARHLLALANYLLFSRQVCGMHCSAAVSPTKKWHFSAAFTDELVEQVVRRTVLSIPIQRLFNGHRSAPQC